MFTLKEHRIMDTLYVCYGAFGNPIYEEARTLDNGRLTKAINEFVKKAKTDYLEQLSEEHKDLLLKILKKWNKKIPK